MATLIFEGHSGYGDTGIEEFSFIYNGDRFKILPKPGSYDKLESFMKYVQYIAPKTPDKNPWRYRVNADQRFSRVFDIYKNGKKLEDASETKVDTPDLSKPPQANPGAEQMEMPLTASLDSISDRLERLGCIKEAYALDVIANMLDRWVSSQSTQFFDEVTNQGIEPDTAVKVLDIAGEHGLRA
jgi:hypothetical protein